jgi:hypothetical protein
MSLLYITIWVSVNESKLARILGRQALGAATPFSQRPLAQCGDAVFQLLFSATT